MFREHVTMEDWLERKSLNAIKIEKNESTLQSYYLSTTEDHMGTNPKIGVRGGGVRKKPKRLPCNELVPKQAQQLVYCIFSRPRSNILIPTTSRA